MSSDTDWVASVINELVPKMLGSSIVISLVPRTETDVKFAVELGIAIMLDKPIIALVFPGTQVPEHLIRVADRIIEVEPAEMGSEAFGKRLMAVVKEFSASGNPENPVDPVP